MATLMYVSNSNGPSQPSTHPPQGWNYQDMRVGIGTLDNAIPVASAQDAYGQPFGAGPLANDPPATVPTVFYSEPMPVGGVTIAGSITVHTSMDMTAGYTGKLRARIGKVTFGGSDVETPIAEVDATSDFTVGTGVLYDLTVTPPSPVTLAENERITLRLYSVGTGAGGSYGSGSIAVNYQSGATEPTRENSRTWLNFSETFTPKLNYTTLYPRDTATIGVGNFLDLLTSAPASPVITSAVGPRAGQTLIPWTRTNVSDLIFTELTAAQIASTSNAATYTSASFTPQPNRLYLLAVVHSDAAPEATVPTITTTTGLTFVQVGSSMPFDTIASNTSRLTLFRAMKASGLSAGTFTVNLADAGTGCAAVLVDVQNTVVTGTDGDDAVRNVVSANADATTNPKATLGVISQSYNGVYQCFGSDVAGGTGGTGYTVSANATYATPTAALRAKWKAGMTAIAPVQFTLSASNWATIAVEIVAANPPLTLEWISPRVKVGWQVPSSEHFDGAWRVGESGGSANVGARVTLFRRTPDGAESAFLSVENDLEISAPSTTTYAMNQFTRTVTPMVLNEDDRIVCRLYAFPLGGTGAFSDGFTASVDYGYASAAGTHVIINGLPPLKAESDPPRSEIVPSGGSTLGISNGQ